MVRLLSALALVICSFVLIQAEDDATPAMANDMGGNLGSGYNDACRDVRCSRGFRCAESRDSSGYQRAKCVQSYPKCEDLTGQDDWDDWDDNDRNRFGDEAGLSNDAPAEEERRRRQNSGAGTCREDRDCNRGSSNSYYAAKLYKCCRLQGEYNRYCFSVPSYTPRRRY